MDSEFHSRKPMFFKVILANIIKQRRLEIPSGFVKFFVDCSSNRVILRVPDGNSWEVEMLKIGEEVCLSKGWVEFAEHHSLKHGHLLVFKYEGNSQFDVMIFDMSATEIDYPGSRDSKSRPEIKKNKQNNARLSDHQQHIRDFGGNLASSSKLVDASATNFTSSNPSFKIHLKMIQSQRRFLNVPYTFMQKHMECKTETVMLKVEDQVWPVKLRLYPQSRASGFYNGWSSFLIDNSLKKGDVCIFEFVGNDTLSVSIFDSKSQPKLNKNKETTALISDPHIQQFGGNLASSSKIDASATNFTSSNPWFKVHIKSVRGLRKYLTAPYSFIQKHMKCITKIITLKVEDKSWPVKLFVNPNAKASGFYAGVPSFTRENFLKVGDSCIFEFVGNNTFHVSFFRS